MLNIAERFDHPETSFGQSQEGSIEIDQLESHVSAIKSSTQMLGDDVQEDFKVLVRTDKKTGALRNQLMKADKDAETLKKHPYLGLVKCGLFGLFCLALFLHYALRFYGKLSHSHGQAVEVPPPPPSNDEQGEAPQIDYEDTHRIESDLTHPDILEDLKDEDQGRTQHINYEDIDPNDPEVLKMKAEKSEQRAEAIQEQADLPL